MLKSASIQPQAALGQLLHHLQSARGIDRKEDSCRWDIESQPLCWNPPTLETDKEMSKKERGNSDRDTSRDGKIVLVKRYDYCLVTLASSFVGVGQEGEAQRWDKKRKHRYQASSGCEEIQPGHGWSRQAGPAPKPLQNGNKIKKNGCCAWHE